jgi:hypothetical protein
MYEWLAHRVAQAKEVLQDFAMDWTFMLNPPASQAEIDACESLLGLQLPPSYREFLLHFNGAELFHPEQQNSDAPGTLISIMGTQSVVNLNAEMIYKEDRSSILLFCEAAHGLGGDFCGFSLQQIVDGECAVVFCQSGNSMEDWINTYIAVSFMEWLNKIFNHVIEEKKFPLYWDIGYFGVEELDQISERYQEYGWCSPSDKLEVARENNQNLLSSTEEQKNTTVDESHIMRSYKEANVIIDISNSDQKSS